jgi:hypothetical protein
MKIKLPAPPPPPKNWNPFDKIIRTAKSWTPPGCRFMPVGEISILASRPHGGFWCPPWEERPFVKIEIGWKEGEPLVWHEAFHSVFDNCIMKHYDPAWAEGWCNAFAEVHHRHFHAPDPKRLKPGTHGKDEYATPCYLLCRLAKFDAAQLKKIWLKWNQTDPVPRPGAFSRYMGYWPTTGKIR